MILILLFLSDFWLGILNFKNAKHLKEIGEELMPIGWHPKKWWDWCVSEDEKKRKRSRYNFYRRVVKM